MVDSLLVVEGVGHRSVFALVVQGFRLVKVIVFLQRTEVVNESVVVGL